MGIFFCIKSLDHSTSQKELCERSFHSVNHLLWQSCNKNLNDSLRQVCTAKGQLEAREKELTTLLALKVSYLPSLHLAQQSGFGWVNCVLKSPFSVCFCLLLCPRLVWTVSFELPVILSWLCAVNRVLKSKNLRTYRTVHRSWTNLGMFCWSFYKEKIGGLL